MRTLKLRNFTAPSLGDGVYPGLYKGDNTTPLFSRAVTEQILKDSDEQFPQGKASLFMTFVESCSVFAVMESKDSVHYCRPTMIEGNEFYAVQHPILEWQELDEMQMHPKVKGAVDTFFGVMARLKKAVSTQATEEELKAVDQGDLPDKYKGPVKKMLAQGLESIASNKFMLGQVQNEVKRQMPTIGQQAMYNIPNVVEGKEVDDTKLNMWMIALIMEVPMILGLVQGG